MSIFQVQLNNTLQGLLDLNPTGGDITTNYLGAQMDPSIQRTMYVMGPNRINRKLVDGATFTDCNYWLRWAYPQVPYDQAIVSVVYNDGSIYSDYSSENNYPWSSSAISTASNSPAAGGPIVIVKQNSAFSAGASNSVNNINFQTTYGTYAVMLMIMSLTNDAINVRLNGNANAVVYLPGNGTLTYDLDDFEISQVEFQGSASADVDIVVSASLKGICNS